MRIFVLGDLKPLCCEKPTHLSVVKFLIQIKQLYHLVFEVHLVHTTRHLRDAHFQTIPFRSNHDRLVLTLLKEGLINRLVVAFGGELRPALPNTLGDKVFRTPISRMHPMSLLQAIDHMFSIP